MFGDLAFLFVLLPVAAAWYSTGLWWFHAHTTWLSRLSARGLLDGRYTPAPERGVVAATRWFSRQVFVPTDAFRMEGLVGEDNEDRVTDVWRIRAVRRKRVLIASVPAALLVMLIAEVLVENLEPVVFLVVTLAAALAFAWPARRLYVRLRDWGNVGDVV